VADQAIDARAKTGTAPDEASELRLKSAYQRLITDVSGFAPTVARSSLANANTVGEHYLALSTLTQDIRAISIHKCLPHRDCFVGLRPPRNDVVDAPSPGLLAVLASRPLPNGER